MSKSKAPAWYDVLSTVIAKGISRILLYGPPDTGKTTTASLLRPDKPVYRVQCSRQQGIEDILGAYVLHSGATIFAPGPVARAMADGGTLLVDEFDFRNPAHDSIWHSVLDDPKLAEVRLPDGSVVKPASGFLVIATTNASPNAFSPALQRRFELKLFCGTTHPQALNSLPDELASMIRNWQLTITPPTVKVELSVSSLTTYSRLTAHYGQDVSASLVFGANAQEFISALANNVKA